MAETKGATFNVSVEGNAATAGKEIAASAVEAAQAMMRLDDEAKSLSTDYRRLKGKTTEVVAEKAVLKARLDEIRSTSTQLALAIRKQGSTFTEAAAVAKKAEQLKADAAVEAAKRITKAQTEGKRLAEEHEKAKTEALKKGEDKRKAILEKSAKRKDAKRDAQKEKGGIVATALKARDMQSRFKDLTEATGSKGGAIKAMIGEARLGTSALQGLGRAGSLAASGAAIAAAAAAAAAVAIAAAVASLVSFAWAASNAEQKMQRQRQALLGNAEDAKAFGTQIDALAGKVPQGTAELNELALSLSKTRLTGKAMVSTMNAVAQVTGAVDAAAGKKLEEIVTRGQNTGRMVLGKRELLGTGLEFDDVAKAYADGTKKSLTAARKELSSGRAPLEAGAEALRKATEKKFGALNKKNAFDLENGPKKIMQAFTKLSSGVDLSPLTDGFEKIYDALDPNSPLGSNIKWMIETLGGGFAEIAGDAIPSVIEGFKWLMVGALKLYTKFYEVKKALKDAFAADGWEGVGKTILEGLANGIKAAVTLPLDAMNWVAEHLTESFKEKLKIRSPSKVFEGYGRFTTEGYAQGIERSAPQAREAVRALASSAESGAALASYSSGTGAPASLGAPVIHNHWGSMTPQQVAESQSALEMITKCITDAYKSAGLQMAVAA